MAAGALNVTMADPLLAVALPMVGVPGKAAGVAGADAAEAGPVPMALVAVTVKVYDIPLVSPVTVHEVLPVVVQVIPDEEVTLYPVIGRPPFEPGGVQETTDCPLANDVAVTPVGAPGVVGTTTELDGRDNGPVPTAFVAVTVKVYVPPTLSPEMVVEVAVALVTTRPVQLPHAGDGVTVYLVIG